MPAGFQAFGSAAGYVGNGSFSPINVSGLTLWLRADLGVALNGSNVSAWDDQSQTGDANKNVTQASGSLQPAFTASNASYNNRPTIDFTGSQLLRSGAWVLAQAQPFTRLIVGHGANDGTNNYFMDNIAGTQAAIIAASSGILNLFDGTTLIATGATVGSPEAIVSIDNGGSSKIYSNAKTAKNTGAAGSGQITGTTIGNYQGGGAFALTGSIAEIAIWDRALTQTEIESMLAYAGVRYGMTIGA